MNKLEQLERWLFRQEFPNSRFSKETAHEDLPPARRPRKIKKINKNENNLPKVAS